MEMINRRSFIRSTTAAGAALISGTALRRETPDVNALKTKIENRHDENARRIQDWTRQPSIAAENRGMNEGCDMMMQLLRDAGFDTVNKVAPEGHPGVFATLDAGAPRTVGI